MQADDALVHQNGANVASRIQALYEETYMQNVKFQCANSKSSRSLESTLTSGRSETAAMPDSGNLVYYILDGETVYAEKFDFRVQLTKQNFAELRMVSICCLL